MGHDLHSSTEDTGKDGHATAVPQQLAVFDVIALREPLALSFSLDLEGVHEFELGTLERVVDVSEKQEDRERERLVRS